MSARGPSDVTRGAMWLVRRYLTLLGLQLRMSAVHGMQYRADFIANSVISLLWVVVTLVPVFVVLGKRPSIAGWTGPEMLIVVGWFSLLKALLEGAISPSLTQVVEYVRKGTLDFVLLKPADAQFMVSTARFEPWRIVEMAASLFILGLGVHRVGRWPEWRQVVLAGVLLGVSVLILYSIWILVVCASFWVVRVDNLSYLFGSLFDVGRWPSSVFRGALRIVFTFIFPVALMTTYPSLALLGRLDAGTAALSIAGGVAFAVVARAVWKRALRYYTSASS